MAEKINPFFERLEEVMRHAGAPSLNQLAGMLGYEASQKLNRLKDPKANPSVDIIMDILKKWPEIEANWLVMGKGPMISNEIETREPKEINTPSLGTIQKGLNTVLEQQRLTRAEVRAYGQYQVGRDARGDQDQVVKILAEIGMLVASHEAAISKGGNVADTGN